MKTSSLMVLLKQHNYSQLRTEEDQRRNISQVLLISC